MHGTGNCENKSFLSTALKPLAVNHSFSNALIIPKTDVPCLSVPA